MTSGSVSQNFSENPEAQETQGFGDNLTHPLRSQMISCTANGDERQDRIRYGVA